jgi:hypothetical protein
MRYMPCLQYLKIPDKYISHNTPRYISHNTLPLLGITLLKLPVRAPLAGQHRAHQDTQAAFAAAASAAD